MDNKKEIYLRGYPICAGIAIGRPFYFATVEENIPEFSIPDDQIDNEVDRYYSALKSSRNDLIFLQKRLLKEGGSEAAAILGSHLEITRDPFMTVGIEEAIRQKGKNIEYIFKTAIGEYEEQFRKISNVVFRERLKDFQDISRRIIGHLRNHERYKLSRLNYKSIVFAHELSPSNTAEANTEVIEAFVTRSGAETAHVAIMARARGIPFVSNVDFPDFSISVPPQVIVNGGSGEVVINPKKETVAFYQQEKKKLKIHINDLKDSIQLQAQTTDGYKIYLSANIEMFNEVDRLDEYGGEGVGLFRSEYLFLAGEVFPSEEEQFLIYRRIVEKVGGYRSVIRTFDIGGDKLGNFHMSRYENNPYLGCRAIRLMLKERNVFKTQIRAILRASAFGEVSILFPMISGVVELREAKEIVREAQEELLREKIPFAHNIPIGCMIEVPSAAITCDLLAKECDFLSIGTNDLIQYSLAVDRDNPMMSYLYTPTHPSILRLIKLVVEEGNREKKPISICGEMAADPRYIPLLLGLGVHDFSVSSRSIPMIKNIIRHLSIIDARAITEKALLLSTSMEVEEFLEEAYTKFQSKIKPV
ncbi:MAG: phosphoenolpyruvate--protein phosphotransferase [Chlamydiales bacterium]